MTTQDFLTAWGGEKTDSPLARFRQSLQNVKGYGELILEEFATDGFRPRIAPILEDICIECRGLTRAFSDLLASSDTFVTATSRLHAGLHPTVDAMLRRIDRMIQTEFKEPFAPDLKTMRLATQSLRTLLDEVSQKGRVNLKET